MDVVVKNQDVVLSMVRGDSEGILVKFRERDETGIIQDVPFENGKHIVYFTVKESTRDSDEEAKIQIKETFFLDDGQALISIRPHHTKNMAYGEYVYDIQLTTIDEGDILEVKTIVPKSTFKVTEEVTHE